MQSSRRQKKPVGALLCFLLTSDPPKLFRVGLGLGFGPTNPHRVLSLFIHFLWAHIQSEGGVKNRRREPKSRRHSRCDRLIPENCFFRLSNPTRLPSTKDYTTALAMIKIVEFHTLCVRKEDEEEASPEKWAFFFFFSSSLLLVFSRL